MCLRTVRFGLWIFVLKVMVGAVAKQKEVRRHRFEAWLCSSSPGVPATLFSFLLYDTWGLDEETL